MKTDKNNKNIYKTSSLNLSAFLYAKGVTLKGIEKSDSSNKSTFIFADASTCEDLTQIFNFAPDQDARTMVDARKLLEAIKSLKDRLYNNN